ncbi:MAG TPA: amino acid adenylation domain-containing protein, partial [Micromonosporaceae bacterium]|nr:amino acid adenylation domain-containing protein [Micromonosporaceae bacterium]
RFDLELHLFETAGAELLGRVIYARDLFDAATVERFAAQYGNLLAAAVAAPRNRVSQLASMDPAELAQLDSWSRGRAVPAPTTPNVTAHFEAQVAAAPDAPAVEYDGGSLTYGELNAAANRLARHLCERGVGPETTVAVCLPRGIDAVVSVLAVVKAGGAYVPLDPADPPSRLAMLAGDAGARLVVTDAAGAALVPDLEVLRLDRIRDRLGGYDPADLPPRAEPTNLLYVVFTSGSTGRPKGIAMDHRSKLNLMQWTAGRYRARPRVLQFYGVSPDTYLLELFLAWWTGGTLVLVPEETRRDMPALARLVRERDVTTAVLPAVVLEHLARHVEERPEELASLREIATTGDRQRLTPAVRRLFTALPDCLLDNHYGQTEANVVTLNRLAAPVDGWPDEAPMGSPIDNLRAYVLDAAMQPVPPGSYGEVFVGGAGLARGYVGRSDLTAAAFVPDPFGTEPGGRLYRTGDRARRRLDGTLEFAGRFDFQVKISGYRIEPGDVETSLGALPAVDAAAVVCDRSTGDEPRLVAYVTARRGRTLTPEGVRAQLRRTLPAYLVPPVVVVLDEFPRTASGKIDRGRLPMPASTGDGTPGALANPTERIIAGVWTEVLGLDRISSGDNFFALGGHSLLVTRVVYRLREALGVELPLRSIFEAPTVAALAAQIDHAVARRTPVLEPAPRTGRIPLSYAQQRLWFLDRAFPETATYNNMVALRIRGPLNVDALTRALSRIEERHEVLRTRFPDEDGQPFQQIDPPSPVRLRVVDVSAEPAAEREHAARAVFGGEQLRPFDLANGPLVRYLLIRLDADEVILGVLLHHAVSDTGTAAVLRREIAHFYDPDAPPLAPLPVQYADYAVWQSSTVESDALSEQLDHWQQRLDGAPAVLDLVTDHPRPADAAQLHASGRVHDFTVAPELTARLEELGRGANATL